MGLPEKPDEPKKEQAGDQIEVGLDLWRKRAESLVRYRASQDGQRTITQEEIRKKFDGLVKAELKVGREAMLFLQPGTDAEGKPMYRLVGIAPADPRNQQAFDHLVAIVRTAIEKGVWGHINR